MALVSQIRRRNQEYQARVTKRGRPLKVPREQTSIGPMVVAFFVFVVIGSGRQKKDGESEGVPNILVFIIRSLFIAIFQLLQSLMR
jgi:hypothetical protein